MELYRIFPYDPEAPAGTAGHPLFLHRRQTIGRWDNAHSYATWYFSESAVGAAGETFGSLGTWRQSMFETPSLPSARRALAVFEIDDDLPQLNLDDASALAARGARPSQVVTRNIAFTQPFALSVFRETNPDGSRRWAGIRWWSFHRPTWVNVALWETDESPSPLSFVRIERLDIEHPAIVSAATELLRERPASSRP